MKNESQIMIILSAVNVAGCSDTLGRLIYALIFFLLLVNNVKYSCQEMVFQNGTDDKIQKESMLSPGESQATIKNGLLKTGL